MTHHDELFSRVPAHLAVGSAPGADPVDVEEIRLPVRGQGTVGLRLNRMEPFTVTIGAPDLWGAPAFRWHVDFARVVLSERTMGQWAEVSTFEAAGVGVDPEIDCAYWFSFDSHNRRLRYGKGEMRVQAALACHDVVPAADGAPDSYAWLAQATSVELAPPTSRPADVWRDPVVVDPPLKVLPLDSITMDAMAEGEVTVAANLTPACQQLYGNVAGRAFQLDTPDFPDFSKAIEASIADPNGWCYKTLEAKASEFGSPDPDKTYLRITMGQNQGESPGIPFVMEIWPPGHYSPIHNHGGADAVIKVLHGAITVSLFAMLSPHHQQPFADAVFEPGDVTWISPRLNQVHQLKNNGTATCVTIQCYEYAETNLTHYPYFDYLEKFGVAQFDPNSDMDYLAFKATMRDEWAARPR